MSPLDYERTTTAQAPDGTRLFYGLRGGGDAPAAVLCDGIGRDGFVWRYLQPTLARERLVLHWHYPGHGRSEAPRDRSLLTIDALAEALWRVVDAAGLDRCVLLGHSMGTQVALEAYRRRAEQVAALVLLCGSYGRITHTFHGTSLLARSLPRLLQWVERHPGGVRALWGRVSARFAYRVARLSREIDGLALSEQDFTLYWEHIRWMDPELFLHLLQAAGEHSAEDLLPRIAVPTLVVAAERDTFTPPWLARRMAERIPTARFEVVPGASHAAPVEQPTLVQRWVLQLLGTLR